MGYLKFRENIRISSKEYLDQVDVDFADHMGASGLYEWSCKGNGARINRCPVKDSFAVDFEHDSEMEWDYSDYHVLEDISEESDRY